MCCAKTQESVTNHLRPEEDTELSSNLIGRMVGAMTPYDAGVNHQAQVNYEVKDKNGKLLIGPGVSSDFNNGNTENYHPIRTAYIEGEFIDFGANTPKYCTDDAVNTLHNSGLNAAPVKTAIVNAIRDGIIQDMRVQPLPPKKP